MLAIGTQPVGNTAVVGMSSNPEWLSNQVTHAWQGVRARLWAENPFEQRFVGLGHSVFAKEKRMKGRLVAPS
ncbi:MAG TPA: hypothetical protein V6C81_31685 [Planktothrix sp.]|jgi:hypothetical protein